MNLKDNFNKKEISKAFGILKDKIDAASEADILGGIMRLRQEADLKNRIKAFAKKEKAIWAELRYEEAFAKGIDAWDRMDTRRIFAAGGAVLAVGLIAFTVQVAMQPSAFSLEVNGTQLGYVQSQEAVDEAMADMENNVKQTLGVEDVIVKDGAIVCTPTREKNVGLMDQKEIAEAILEADVCRVDAWAISVNDRRIVAAATKNQAEQILQGVNESYMNDGGEILSASYKEKVEVEPCSVGINDVVPVDKAVTYVVTGSEEPQKYTVKDGDTLWDIAVANDMKPAELVAANPDFEPDKLKIGQVLNLMAVKPYLTVTLTEKLVAKEAIPFDTVYEDSGSINKGQTKVKTAGVNGQKEVTSQIVKENGKIVATNVLSEKVISDPVAQVAYRGTKAVVLVASSRGSGRVGHPLSSINPSANGGLFGASRGGRRHLGVDLRSSKGAPIFAAESGTVSKVSTNGSYGKLIVINHGGGLTTKYAHCNSIEVSAGQKVQKGERIGTVGSTGNATGYILHFEVLINGTNVNPLNYL